MPDISITINHHNYTVACESGDEAIIQRYAAEIDERISELAKAASDDGNQLSQAHLLVIGSLMLVEELTKARLSAANSKDLQTTPELPKIEQRLEKITATITRLAQRLEAE
ncbi:MAG: cell division protein ZapA [Candidatus Pacebacteria bacterium]|nr:cell division protein ZapA [Candidatus Paceibacterota bacterium]